MSMIFGGNPLEDAEYHIASLEKEIDELKTQKMDVVRALYRFALIYKHCNKSGCQHGAREEFCRNSSAIGDFQTAYRVLKSQGLIDED